MDLEEDLSSNNLEVFWGQNSCVAWWIVIYITVILLGR